MSELAQDSKEHSDTFSRSELESKVIAANVDFYRQVGNKFDVSESYLFDPLLQGRLIADLDQIGSHFALLGRRPTCLDCGGGTGNLALKMCARGWTVTVVDVSDKMLGLLEAKARTQGHSPTLIQSPVERFLATTHENYDLISFSAVLHHLYSYVHVVREAFSRVRPGGFFYSNHDPVVPQWPRWARALDSLDIAIAKAMFDRGDFLPGVGRRLRKVFSPKDSEFNRAIVSAGDLAEYRAHTGVDDGEILRLLQSNGFAIIEHLRYPGGRTRAVQFLNEQFRLSESFKVIARRGSGFPHTAKTTRRTSADGSKTGSAENCNLGARHAGRPVIEENLEARSKRNGQRNLDITGARPTESFWRKIGSQWKYLMAQEAMRRAPALTLSRLVAWRVRCLLRRPVIARFRRWDMQMLLPPNWRGVEKLIFSFREYYEPELDYLQEILSPGMTFVDAGACYGIYTLGASKIVGNGGRVISFEPASRAFRVLQRNIELNGLTNVLAYPLALTERRGKAWLYHHPNVGCDSLGRDNSFTETAEEIVTDSLDNVLREISVDRVDVLKMDVQGAEELVLRGAIATLRSHHPLVIFEVYPDGTVPLGLSPYGAWELLESLGYEFYVVGKCGALHRKKFPPESPNVVAIYSK